LRDGERNDLNGRTTISCGCATSYGGSVAIVDGFVHEVDAVEPLAIDHKNAGGRGGDVAAAR
jgi:hypothetical protein